MPNSSSTAIQLAINSCQIAFTQCENFLQKNEIFIENLQYNQKLIEVISTTPQILGNIILTLQVNILKDASNQKKYNNILTELQEYLLRCLKIKIDLQLRFCEDYKKLTEMQGKKQDPALLQLNRQANLSSSQVFYDFHNHATPLKLVPQNYIKNWMENHIAICCSDSRFNANNELLKKNLSEKQYNKISSRINSAQKCKNFSDYNSQFKKIIDTLATTLTPSDLFHFKLEKALRGFTHIKNNIQSRLIDNHQINFTAGYTLLMNEFYPNMIQLSKELKEIFDLSLSDDNLAAEVSLVYADINSIFFFFHSIYKLTKGLSTEDHNKYLSLLGNLITTLESITTRASNYKIIIDSALNCLRLAQAEVNLKFEAKSQVEKEQKIKQQQYDSSFSEILENLKDKKPVKPEEKQTCETNTIGKAKKKKKKKRKKQELKTTIANPSQENKDNLQKESEKVALVIKTKQQDETPQQDEATLSETYEELPHRSRFKVAPQSIVEEALTLNQPLPIAIAYARYGEFCYLTAFKALKSNPMEAITQLEAALNAIQQSLLHLEQVTDKQQEEVSFTQQRLYVLLNNLQAMLASPEYFNILFDSPEYLNKHTLANERITQLSNKLSTVAMTDIAPPDQAEPIDSQQASSKEQLEQPSTANGRFGFFHRRTPSHDSHFEGYTLEKMLEKYGCGRPAAFSKAIGLRPNIHTTQCLEFTQPEYQEKIIFPSANNNSWPW